MKLRIPLGIAVAFAACVTFKLVYSAVAEPTSTDDVQIKRGQYLVERVAMCADCHTPRTEKGEIDKAQWLQGNTLDFKPLHPMPFVAVAPRIAGLPTMLRSDSLKLERMPPAKSPIRQCRDIVSTTRTQRRWLLI